MLVSSATRATWQPSSTFDFTKCKLIVFHPDRCTYSSLLLCSSNRLCRRRGTPWWLDQERQRPVPAGRLSADQADLATGLQWDPVGRHLAELLNRSATNM